jgi:hypothetical protein
MCLYPKLIDNKRYKATKKNNYTPPPQPQDQRVLYVPVGCGRCIECTKKKANGWKVRLNEEIRNDNTGCFVTLTFNEESLNKIKNALNKSNYHNYEVDNEIASYAVRHFTELWRKHHKKTIKHFLITELGHKGTERIHLHGILFTKDKLEIPKIWKYGFVYVGGWVNEQTINYISKYITKRDDYHKEYTSKIFCSKGIGSNYLNRTDSFNNIFNLDKTNETYRYSNGRKGGLPIYYRNKLWNEDEREELWKLRMDKNERYILGQRIDMTKSNAEYDYQETLKNARITNAMKGYGTDVKDYELKKYEEKRKKLKQLQYISDMRKKNP